MEALLSPLMLALHSFLRPCKREKETKRKKEKQEANDEYTRKEE